MDRFSRNVLDLILGLALATTACGAAWTGKDFQDCAVTSLVCDDSSGDASCFDP